MAVLRLSGTAALLAAGGRAFEALAVAGKELTVWRLTAGVWAKNVPIAYGSSG